MANANPNGLNQPDNVDNQKPSAALANIVGALISLSILCLLLGWGVRTLSRDASGVPVVRALDGPVRIEPETPGGIIVPHQGLSVNQVASNSLAPDSVPSNLRLAPMPDALTFVDQPLAANTAHNNSPQNGVDETTVPIASVQPDLPLQNPTSSTVSSIRPVSRPTVNLLQSTAHQNTEYSFDSIVPEGVMLAQLGAFNSREIAEREWHRIANKFQDYIVGKSPVIQKAHKTDMPVYRLRVQGFASLEESRQFCGAITAQNDPCFPIVMKY